VFFFFYLKNFLWTLLTTIFLIFLYLFWLNNMYLYKKRFYSARWFIIRTNRNTTPNTITGSFSRIVLTRFLYSVRFLYEFEKFGMKMTTAFASTYICKQTFSTLKRAKPASRARLSDDHLHFILRINVTQLEPNIKKIVSEKLHQTSH
jgi:hypothetical protein